MPKKQHTSRRASASATATPPVKEKAPDELVERVDTLDRWEAQHLAICKLAATLKPDEGYDPEDWKRIAARARWGGSVQSATYRRWRTDLIFRTACEFAYKRKRPDLLEIVNIIYAALLPYETHRRDRMLRIANEFPIEGELAPGLDESLHAVADELLVDGTADSDQPYGMRREEIEIALRHRWPGILHTDIDAGLEEAIRIGKVWSEQFKAKDWDSPDTVYRASAGGRAEDGSIKGQSRSFYYTTSELAEQVGVSNDLISDHAKKAGLRRPGIGERNFRYSADEAEVIVMSLARTGSATVRKKANTWLEKRGRSETNPN